MASETSELTFVRCPSCRSLVPATAARCRICNNPLDGGSSAGPSKSSDSDAQKAASRVRQKTITANPDDVAAVLQDAEEAVDVAHEQPRVFEIPSESVGVRPSAPTEDDDAFDPLSAYLEELDEEPVLPSSAPKSFTVEAQAPAASAFDDAFDFDLFDEPEMASIAPQVATGAPAQSPSSVFEVDQSPVAPVGPTKSSAAAVELSKSVVAPERQVASVVSSVVSAAEPALRRDDPRREDGGRREPPRPPAQQPKKQQQAAPQGQQGGRGGAPQQQRNQMGAVKPNQQPQPQERRGREAAPSSQRESGQQRRDPRGPEQRKAEERGSNRAGHDEQRSGMHNSERRHEERRHDSGVSPAAGERVSSGAPRMGKMRPGRLFGWFVSYESPDGRAIELREGKFFVTGSSIRGTDLILEDPSISTPHALMAISGEGGLIIQDLMSDRGIFVRSASSGGYRREDGTVRIEHGDWVRFGDVEFLAIIVPEGK